MRRTSARGLAILLAFAASPGQAQAFGQWWWDAVVGGSGRGFSNRVGGERTSDFDQTDLRLGFGLNGYVVHPAVARFRLGIDLLFSTVEGGRSVDTDRSGGRLDIGLFDRGPYPITLFFHRQLYDYTGITQDDPLRLLGVPDTTTTFGGRVRFRRGPLTGLQLGFEQDQLDFLLDREGDELRGRQFADWTAAGRRLKHHLRLERHRRDFGRVDLRFDDLSFNWNEHGTLGDGWRIDFSTFAMRRGVRFAASDQVDIDTVRLFGQATRTLATDDILSVNYNGGLTRASGTPSFESHAIGGRYLWRRWRRWQVNTFGDLSVQRGATTRLFAPQAGVSATWTEQVRSFEVSITGGGSYRLLDGNGAGGADAAFGLQLLAHVAHGDERTLRTELEAEVDRSELRAAGTTLDDLPDLGTSLTGIGTQDRYRARLTLRRRWGATSAHAYGDWTRRESSAERLGDDFATDSLIFSLQLSGRHYSLLANAGETRADGGRRAGQDVRFQALSASLRPWRALSVRASYRADERAVSLGPDIDGERFEAGFDFHLGALTLSASAFQTDERFTGADTRTNEGFRWSVTRRIAGLLPIVSAPKRRGRILGGAQ